MRYVFLFLLLFVGFRANAQGIEFFKGSFEEAKAMAAEEGRLIFVDAYTTWCGPCKRMSKNVFPQAAVGDFFNAQFINMKIDMEKGEGRDFQRNYQVRAFPTLLFLDSDGKVVHKKIGGTNPQGLVALGKEAAAKGDPTSKLTAKYNAGERDPDFMVDYVKALSKSQRPRLKVVNDYLKENKEIEPEVRKTLVYYGCERADSKIFDELVSEKNEYTSTFGANEINNRIQEACANTVTAAIEFESEDLLLFANDKAEQYLPESNSFMLENKIRYFNAYPSAMDPKKLVKESVNANIQTKEVLAFTLLQDQNTDLSLLKKMHKLITADNGSSDNLDACFICAQLQKRIGNKEDAMRYAGKALELAESNNSPSKQAISSFILDLGKEM